MPSLDEYLNDPAAYQEDQEQQAKAGRTPTMAEKMLVLSKELDKIYQEYASQTGQCLCDDGKSRHLCLCTAGMFVLELAETLRAEGA